MTCETVAVQTLTVQQIGEIIQTAYKYGVEELEIVDERPGNPRLLLYFRRGHSRQKGAAVEKAVRFGDRLTPDEPDESAGRFILTSGN